MKNNYFDAMSQIKASEELNNKIIQRLNEEKNKKMKGVVFMNKIRKLLIGLGTVAGMAICGGLAYAGINANKPHVEDYGITFSDNYNEYEYSFESKSIQSNGTIIKLESAVCNEGFTVLKFDITLNDEIKKHADETVGLEYLSYNDEIDEGNFPRLGGANYNLIIDGKKQWIRGKYASELNENIINKNYTDYELYFLPNSIIGNKSSFTITLKDFRLNVGEKLYEIPGEIEFEVSKEKALKATTEILGNAQSITYKSMKEKIEKVSKTPLQNLIKINQEISNITFTLTDEEYTGDIDYEVFDQNGNKLISKVFDTDMTYVYKNGKEEKGDLEDGLDDYSKIAKIIYERYVVTEKSEEIKSLNIKVYSTNEYYGTRVQIGEYTVNLDNKTIITKNTNNGVIRKIAENDNQRDAIISDIKDFIIELDEGEFFAKELHYSIGNQSENAKARGYLFGTNTTDEFFTIVVMDKNEQYIFKGLNNTELKQIKITENATKKIILLDEPGNAYNKYKATIDSIIIK